MNIHEYQAKQLLKSFGCPVSIGYPIYNSSEARSAASKLDGPLWVVKAQIHAGGRGKGSFKETDAGDKGGVRLTFSIDEATAEAEKMLGNTLVTHQTGPAGKQVNRIYIEDGSDIETELYLAVLLDRVTSRISFVASTEGGMDIEAVAEETPEKIITVTVDPSLGFTKENGKDVSNALKLTGKNIDECIELTSNLYRMFVEKDMDMLEINPLIVMENGGLKA